MFLISRIAAVVVSVTALSVTPNGTIAGAASAQTAPFVLAKCDADAPVLGTVQLPQAVLADGKRLIAGTYQVRLTSDRPTPAPGQSPNAECWVEFLKNNIVVGREVAVILSNADIGAVAKGPAPKPNAARVDVLKGGEYIRAWLNHASANYILNLPIAAETRP